MSEQQSQAIRLVPEPDASRPIEITFTGDSLLVVGALAWVLWDRLFKSKVVSKLDGVFAPIEEERKLTNILAQIGVITHASRVVLGAFHNGAIDNAGYHLTKVSAINSYTAPGHLPMSVPIRDLPVGRIMYELEEMLKKDEKEWTVVRHDETLPEPCRDHLRRNNIYRMYNRLIKIGTGQGALPIGILSLQYAENERRNPPVDEEPYSLLLEELYEQIAYLMRRRIIHPGPLRMLWMRISGKSRTSPSK